MKNLTGYLDKPDEDLRSENLPSFLSYNLSCSRGFGRFKIVLGFQKPGFNFNGLQKKRPLSK